MAKDQISINLLDNKGKSFTEQFLDWALAIGRLLIIVTETVALAAFLYRFSIDRRIIDLHDEIKRDQAMVGYFLKGEETYRHVQQKLTTSKKNTTSSPVVTLFEDMVRISGSDITFSNLTVSPGLMEISAKATNVATLSEFVQEVKKHAQVASVAIDKVENRPSSSTVIVTLSVQLKTKGEELPGL